MANTGNTQQQINYGAAANDGQGDPLRTAFIKTDDNFDAIWNAGPVGSNITIVNNTVQANNVNGNIVLRPNGIGVIQANAAVLPNATNLRDLGSTEQRFRAAYIGTGGLNVDGNVTVTGNLTAGNISYTGNVFVGDLQGSVYADDSTIMVDAVNNEMFASDATFVRANVIGNIGANYFVGNGSRLTGIVGYGNTEVEILLANFGNNNIQTLGRISAPSGIGGNGQVVYNYAGNLAVAPSNFNFDQDTLTLFLTILSVSGREPDGHDAIYAGVPGVTPLGSDVIMQAYGNSATYSQINMENVSDSPQSSGDFIITADNGTDSTHFVNIGMASSNWDGTQPNSLGANVGPNDGYLYTQDGNLVIGVKSGVSDMYLWRFSSQGITGSGNIIPSANAVYSLGNATNYWSNLWVANNTIYIGGVPLGITAGNVLTVDGEAVLSNDSNATITTTGNITADYFFGNGSLLSGLSTGSISNGTSNVEIVTANGNVTINTNSNTWTFGTDGVLTTPSDILLNGDITSNTGTLTLQSANNGNAYVQLDDTGDSFLGAAANLYLLADADNREWIFDTTGTLTTPGDITVGGDITGRAAANTLVVKAQPTTDTYIQLNSIVDSTVSIFANLEIVTDSSNTAQTWTFGTDGVLTAPGAISATGNITAVGYKTNGNSVTLGNGNTGLSQGINSVAIGYNSGNAQGFSAVAIGYNVGNAQGNGAVAIGNEAGFVAQGVAAVAIGAEAGSNAAGEGAVAVGYSAGYNNQSVNTVAVGREAARNLNPAGTQGEGAVAVGAFSGWANQGPNSVAIGYYAALSNQGINSIAIGAGAGTISGNVTQAIGNNSIILNATGANFAGTTANAFYVNPVRNDVGNVSNVVTYNTATKEVTYTDTISVAGNITGANLITTGNITGNTAGFAIGYRDIPQVSFTGNATIAAADAGKHFYSTESTDYILTIADNSAVSWPVGTAVTVVNRGTGNITVAQASGVSLYLAGNSSAGNRTVTTYGMVTLLNVAANVWMINGTGVS